VHTAAVLVGELYTFGLGKQGALGLGNLETQLVPQVVQVVEWSGKHVVAVSCFASCTAAVLDDGTLFMFGRVFFRRNILETPLLLPTRVQLGDPLGATLPPPHVVGVALCGNGDMHMAVWTRNGRVFCWGETAAHGKLGAETAVAGDGSVSSNPHLPREVAGLPRTVKTVVCGSDHNTYALTRDGRVFAWGRGIGGQLGLGATDRDHDAPRLMGPVQGRVVTDVFTTHDGTVWLAIGGAKDAAAGDEQPPGRADAGGVVANPIIASASYGAGSMVCI
jgi:regulator of chromosome condensation